MKLHAVPPWQNFWLTGTRRTWSSTVPKRGAAPAHWQKRPLLELSLSCRCKGDIYSSIIQNRRFCTDTFQCWTQDWPKYLVIPVWWPWQTEVSQIKCLSSKTIIVGCPTYSVEGPWDQGVQSFQYNLLGLWPLWQLVHILIFRKRSHQSIINISMTSSTTEKDLQHRQKVWISNAYISYQTVKKTSSKAKTTDPW